MDLWPMYAVCTLLDMVDAIQYLVDWKLSFHSPVLAVADLLTDGSTESSKNTPNNNQRDMYTV